MVLAAVVVAVFVFTTGERRRAVEIVTGTASGDVVVLEVGSCGGEPAVAELEESASEVRVTVEATTRPLGPAAECLDGVEVRLSAPLGDRVLVDGASGQPVEVQGAD